MAPPADNGVLLAHGHTSHDVDVLETDGLPVQVTIPENPNIMKAEIALLKPTQMTVGLEQVYEKVAAMKKRAANNELNAWLHKNPVPVAEGPGGVYYLLDHHHLARAVHEAGYDSVWIVVAQRDSGSGSNALTSPLDLHVESPDKFWGDMGDYNLVWASDDKGVAHTVEDFRKAVDGGLTIATLKDDPYRSLAALVRNAGGYEKQAVVPYAEFKWANFFRHNGIQLPTPGSDAAKQRANYEDAIKAALAFIHNNPDKVAAANLPGTNKAHGGHSKNDDDKPGHHHHHSGDDDAPQPPKDGHHHL